MPLGKRLYKSVFFIFEIALARISRGYRNRKVCHNQSSPQSCSFFSWFLVEAKSAESWKPQDLNPREALSQLSCRELALREQLFNIFSFLDLKFHYIQTHSSFFMALKKRLVEKSLFHSSPGIYPAFALFATMLACFVTAFLYWTPYICTVFALDRT